MALKGRVEQFKTLFKKCSKEEQESIIQYPLLPNRRLWEVVAYKGHFSCLEFFLNSLGQDNIVNPLQQSIIHFVCAGGNIEAILWCVKHLPREILCLKDCFQRNALHWAVRHGHSQGVSILIENGFSVDVKDIRDLGLIFLGLKSRSLILYQTLKKCGADFSILNDKGQNLLHALCTQKNFDFSSDLELVNWLVDNDFEFEIKDNNGETLLEALYAKSDRASLDLCLYFVKIKRLRQVVDRCDFINLKKLYAQYPIDFFYDRKLYQGNSILEHCLLKDKLNFVTFLILQGFKVKKNFCANYLEPIKDINPRAVWLSLMRGRYGNPNMYFSSSKNLEYILAQINTHNYFQSVDFENLMQGLIVGVLKFPHQEYFYPEGIVKGNPKNEFEELRSKEGVLWLSLKLNLDPVSARYCEILSGQGKGLTGVFFEKNLQADSFTLLCKSLRFLRLSSDSKKQKRQKI